MSETAGRWKIWVAPMLLVIGLGLLGLSFVLPLVDRGQADWTPADAIALQQAASRFHELSFSTTPASSADEKQQLRDAQDAHESLNSRRKSAIAAAEWRKGAVRWTGVALAIAGIAGSMFRQPNRG